MLAFDADPRSGIPARASLSRWLGPLTLYVWGDPAARALALADAAQLKPLVGLPITAIAAGQPNLFVAIVANPQTAFAGPLRRLLQLAFAGDEAAVDDYLAAVIGTQACWVLPVWGDPGRTIIKAAIIGADTAQGHPGLEHCVMQKLAASVGLFGPDGTLPRSVFNPLSPATHLSWEDRLLIRALYAPELVAGQSREAAASAAAIAITRLRGRPAARPRQAPPVTPAPAGVPAPSPSSP